MGNANGSTAYQQDNRIPVGTGRGPHGRLPPTVRFRYLYRPPSAALIGA